MDLNSAKLIVDSDPSRNVSHIMSNKNKWLNQKIHQKYNLRRDKFKPQWKREEILKHRGFDYNDFQINNKHEHLYRDRDRCGNESTDYDYHPTIHHPSHASISQQTHPSELIHLCYNVTRRKNVHQSLLQLIKIIRGEINLCSSVYKSVLFGFLIVYMYNDPIQLVINIMTQIRKNQEQHENAYFLQLKTCSSFLECVTLHLSELVPLRSKHLQQLFAIFVLDPSSDDQERSIILDLFYFFLRMQVMRRMHVPLLRFYKQHFEPAILNCRINENYSLLCELYFAFTKFFTALDEDIREDTIADRNAHESLQKQLSLDNLAMAKSILNAVHSTAAENERKIDEMMTILIDIIESERAIRIDLSSDENITDEFKCCLKDIFDSFATNADGSMSADDFRRYILACGASDEAASETRINRILHKNRLTLDSFYAFYARALENRPDHVWDDLYVFGYNNQLTKGDQVHNVQSVYQFLKHNDTFNGILTKYLDQMENDLHILPVPEIIRKRMIELDNMADFLDYIIVSQYDEINIHENSLRQLLYNLSSLELLCVVHEDCEWKQNFIRSKAWDHLIKLYFKYCTDQHSDVCCEVRCFTYLGVTMLFKIMHHLCLALSSSCVPLQIFIRNAYDAQPNGENTKRQVEEILSEQQNYLIGLMVMDAKLGIQTSIGLLNVIPYQVTHVYSEVLICGFISHNIPQDLLNLMCFFF
eukprot:1042980_1